MTVEITAMMKLQWFLLCFVLLPSAVLAAIHPPNVVVLLVDDAGLMDFGGFGGEAATPSIDALADRGVRFSNYHTSPLCSPSRAMLLTGLDNHRAGVATIRETLTPAQQGQPGYGLHIDSDVKTVATKLREVGYRTYMTGKWHLGRGAEELPVANGFDQSFALDASGADNFEQKSYMPYYRTAPWYENDQPATLPDDFYSSQFIVDKMIDYIDTDTTDAPFFAYLAFQAIHIPLQAPRSFIDKYAGVYDKGWDVLRESRWNTARESGLIPMDAPLSPRHPDLPAWDSLSNERQQYYAKSMAVNAAMLDAMDYHIGRFIDHLKASGDFDNTLFIIASDNGPEFNEPTFRPSMKLWMAFNGYTSETETLGEKGSITHIGPAWAEAAATPGSLFKFFTSEGGLHVPLIISGAGVDAQGFSDARAFVTDITPTILDLAGVPEVVRHSGKSMDGRSLTPILSGAASQVYAPDEMVGMEVSGSAALFMGDYKLTRITLPFSDGVWRLYDIAADPGETRDLSASNPREFAQMLAGYATFAERVGVIATPDDFNPIQQVVTNTLDKQIEFYGIYLLAFVLVVLGLIIGFFWRLLRR